MKLCNEKLQSKDGWDNSIDITDLDGNAAKLLKMYPVVGNVVDGVRSGTSSDVSTDNNTQPH